MLHCIEITVGLSPRDTKCEFYPEQLPRLLYSRSTGGLGCAVGGIHMQCLQDVASEEQSCCCVCGGITWPVEMSCTLILFIGCKCASAVSSMRALHCVATELLGTVCWDCSVLAHWAAFTRAKTGYSFNYNQHHVKLNYIQTDVLRMCRVSPT